MIIRKKFSVESAHIVRNCSSDRCKHSMHGHSAIIEVFLEADRLDNAHMVYDFGLMKGTVKQFIDSMDHCYLLCKSDEPEYINMVKKFSDRWIAIPFNPSAEALSMFVFEGVDNILKSTVMENGEDITLHVKSVRYHETTSGYAECDKWDMENIWKDDWSNITFSKAVVADWSDDLKSIILDGKRVYNDIAEQQIKLN